MEDLKARISELEKQLEQTQKDFEQRKQIIGLLQYPIIMASILLGLFFAQFGLGIKIKSFTSDGFEFESFENMSISTSQTTSKLYDEIHFLESKIDAMSSLQKIDTNKLNEEIVATTDLLQLNATNDVAAITMKDAEDNTHATYMKNKEGYIWICNKDKSRSNKILRAQLQVDSGKDLDQLLADGLVNLDFKVAGNMVLRSDLPKNNVNYFRSVKSLGVVPRNTTVEIIEEPQSVERGNIVQYWAKVKVLE